MPNALENISETLERGYILRNFNRAFLKMEESSGSIINQVIGVGKRSLPDGELVPVTHTYPSYVIPLIKAFELYPITKYFGLTPESAMRLPVDQWWEIRDRAMALSIVDQQKTENYEAQMLLLTRELLSLKQAFFEQ